jgi:hypothetical protein
MKRCAAPISPRCRKVRHIFGQHCRANSLELTRAACHGHQRPGVWASLFLLRSIRDPLDSASAVWWALPVAAYGLCF